MMEPVEGPSRMVINGNQAISLGALLGGCRFMSAYPMTPASSILEWLATHASRYGLMVKHNEDEIAALCMAIGASRAGVRAMTATSGGGFSLMVEALGLAGMTETPVVIVEAQRPGPSTGMPTRTEQGDLLFMLRASQGEFPRVVLTPGTVEQCFHAGWRAFNLAEKYQCPVIILIDNFLANSVRSIERADFHSFQKPLPLAVVSAAVLPVGGASWWIQAQPAPPCQEIRSASGPAICSRRAVCLAGMTADPHAVMSPAGQ